VIRLKIDVKSLINYRNFKIAFTAIAIFFIVFGIAMAAFGTWSDVKYTRLEITEDQIARYGHFDALDFDRGRLSVLVIEPAVPVYYSSSDQTRPAILFFHGMFARKEFHLHYAHELARAGFVVIMADHFGQGDSMGAWRLGPELEAIGECVFDWLVDPTGVWFAPGMSPAEYFKINTSQIGATGHSYGGTTTTYLGINRPYNGTPGSGVRTCVSIWTWSNFSDVLEDMLGTAPPQLFLTASWRMLSISGFYLAIGTPYGSYSADAYDLNIAYRDLFTKVNGTDVVAQPPNWLLITGYNDEFTSPTSQIQIMAHACANDTTTASTYQATITAALQTSETWQRSDGDWNNGTMRKIFLPKNYPAPQHIFEGAFVAPLEEMLNWFGSGLSWDVTTNYYQKYSEASRKTLIPGMVDAIPSLAIVMIAGWIIALIGCMMLLVPLVSLVSQYLPKKKSREEYQAFHLEIPEKINSNSDKTTLLLLGVYAGGFILTCLPSFILPWMLNVTPQMIGVPYILFDVTIIGLLSQLMFFAPLVFVLIILEKYKFKTIDTVGDIGISLTSESLLRSASVGALALAIIGLVNLVSLFTLFPTFWIRESPSLGYFGYFNVTFFVCIDVIFEEIFFRGLMQTKIESRVNQKISPESKFLKKWHLTFIARKKKWISYLICTAVSSLLVFSGTLAGLAMLFGGQPIGTGNPGLDLLPSLILATPLFVVIPSIINTYIYQRTRNISAGIIFTTILFGIFYSSTLFGSCTF